MNRILCAGLLLLFSAGAVRADFEYSLAFDQANYSAFVGDTFDVTLTLVETNLDVVSGPASSFTDLVGYSFGVDHGTGISFNAFADSIGTGGIPTPNPAASGVDIIYIDLAAPFGQPAVSGTDGETRTLELGTLTFNADSNGPGTLDFSTFTTVELNFGGGNTVDLDNLPSGSSAVLGTASYSIAVPEPSSIGLVGLVGVIGVFRRKRSA